MPPCRSTPVAMPKLALPTGAVCLLLLGLLPGCARRGAIEIVDAERRFCLADECYQLGPLGPSWQLVQKEDGGIGFFSASIGGVIRSSAACRRDVEAVPLVSLIDHLLVGYTERLDRRAETVDIARRQALHTISDVRLDGVPMVLDLYVWKRNGCLFDLSFAAPPASYERGAIDFSRFVGGFASSGGPTRT